MKVDELLKFSPRAFKKRARAVALEKSEDEAGCLFVSSKGLMKSCDVHQPLPNVSQKRWHRAALRGHKPGGSIYVHAKAMRHFVRRSLPKIETPFALVSGNCVIDVSPESLGEDVVSKILAHPHFVRWHAQNLAFEHEKVEQMPLGLDYHSIQIRHRPDFGPKASPRAQEELLHTIRGMSRPLSQRKVLGYSNWHFALKNGDRMEVIKKLSPQASYFETEQTLRSESWQRNTEFFFTISPRGVGMDCHRTWEAILLGSPPIIPDLPINGQFRSLPVVIVQDWASVTPEYLNAERERLLEEEFDFAPVFLKTWQRRIKGEPDTPSLWMRYQEFMNLEPADLREIIGG